MKTLYLCIALSVGYLSSTFANTVKIYNATGNSIEGYYQTTAKLIAGDICRSPQVRQAITLPAHGSLLLTFEDPKFSMNIMGWTKLSNQMTLEFYVPGLGLRNTAEYVAQYNQGTSIVYTPDITFTVAPDRIQNQFGIH